MVCAPSLYGSTPTSDFHFHKWHSWYRWSSSYIIVCFRKHPSEMLIDWTNISCWDDSSFICFLLRCFYLIGSFCSNFDMTGSQTTSKTMFFEWLLAMSNLANSALYHISFKLLRAFRCTSFFVSMFWLRLVTIFYNFRCWAWYFLDF